MVRRSRRDVALGRHLTIGQRYRHRLSHEIWVVSQIYRTDCQALVEPTRPTLAAGRRVVSFAELRAAYVWIAEREAAAA